MNIEFQMSLFQFEKLLFLFENKTSFRLKMNKKKIQNSNKPVLK